jgi:hypothetical protein
MFDVLDVWRACRQYRSLPQCGGVLDQDPMIMSMFAALDAERARCDAEEIERLKQK